MGAVTGAATATEPAAIEERTSLRTLAAIFIRLGLTAFGGPAAHIAMLHDEVVQRRRWLTEERFLDLLGIANLVPGPTSTELAIHIGFERRRWAGLLVAGLSFIVPATLVTAAFAWAYVRTAGVPDVAWLFAGVKPALLGVIVQALRGLVPKAAKSAWLRVLAVLAAAFALLGVHELAVLFGIGAAGAVAALARRGSAHEVASLGAIFLVFAKIGATLFGSGYVLLAFLRADVVQRLGWITEQQLVDAVAVGQLTPGPVFTTATFIGWVLAGPAGAAAATAGIFLPAFFFVAVSGPLIPRLRASPVAGAFLDALNAASLALMAVVTLHLARASIVDVPTAVIGAASVLLLLRFRPNPTWVLLAGAAAGWIAHALGWA